MSKFPLLTDSSILMSPDQQEMALEALKDFAERAGSDVYLNTPALVEKAVRFTDAIECFGFQVVTDESGNAVGFENGEIFNYDPDFFDVFAPFVNKGGWLQFAHEQELWKLVFNGSAVQVVEFDLKAEDTIPISTNGPIHRIAVAAGARISLCDEGGKELLLIHVSYERPSLIMSASSRLPATHKQVFVFDPDGEFEKPISVFVIPDGGNEIVLDLTERR